VTPSYIPWNQRDLRKLTRVGVYDALRSLERDRDPGAKPDVWATRAVLRMTDTRKVNR
jgi:hypothetical protein